MELSTSLSLAGSSALAFGFSSTFVTTFSCTFSGIFSFGFSGSTFLTGAVVFDLSSFGGSTFFSGAFSIGISLSFSGSLATETAGFISVLDRLLLESLL